MPETDKALKAAFAKFCREWAKVGPGETLMMKVANDARRGPILAAMSKGLTLKDEEAA